MNQPQPPLKCCRDGCDNDAIFHVLMILRPHWPLEGHYEAASTLVLCDEHKQEAEVTGEIFLTEESRESLLVAFQQMGLAAPDFNRTTFEYKPIDLKLFEAIRVRSSLATRLLEGKSWLN